MVRFYQRWLKKNFADLSESKTRKLVMFNMMISAGIPYLLILGTRAFINGDLILGLLDFLMLAISIILVLIVRYKKALNAAVNILLFGFGIFFLVMFAFGIADHQSIVWYFIYPIITLFLMGEKKGSALCLSLIIATILVYEFKDFLPFYTPYPKGLVTRLVASYILSYFLILITEIARRKTEEKLHFTMAELQEKAIRDGLTNLYNRRYLDEVWALILRQAPNIDKRIAFIMIDLDYFKKYNDSFGHQKGDEVLKTFAGILDSLILRKTDHVFRYGGEEFSILLYGTNEENAVSLCENIQKELNNKAINHPNSSLGIVTVSIGLTIVPIENNLNPENIMKAADDALYQAKNTGRNKIKQNNV